jgi:hypothetical protein
MIHCYNLKTCPSKNYKHSEAKLFSVLAHQIKFIADVSKWGCPAEPQQ